MPVCPNCRVAFIEGESHACGSDWTYTDSPLRALARLASGNRGLAVTYWGYAVLGGIVVRAVLLGLSTATGLVAVPAVVGLVWQIAVAGAVWRSAGRYEGRRLWAWLAQTVTGLGVLLALMALFP